jgi:hypothetical protein
MPTVLSVLIGAAFGYVSEMISTRLTQESSGRLKSDIRREPRPAVPAVR